MVWVYLVDSVAGSACGLEGVTVGSGARITAVTVTETSRVGVTIRGGSDEAIEDRIILVIPMIEAAVVGADMSGAEVR